VRQLQGKVFNIRPELYRAHVQGVRERERKPPLLNLGILSLGIKLVPLGKIDRPKFHAQHQRHRVFVIVITTCQFMATMTVKRTLLPT